MFTQVRAFSMEVIPYFLLDWSWWHYKRLGLLSRAKKCHWTTNNVTNYTWVTFYGRHKHRHGIPVTVTPRDGARKTMSLKMGPSVTFYRTSTACYFYDGGVMSQVRSKDAMLYNIQWWSNVTDFMPHQHPHRLPHYEHHYFHYWWRWHHQNTFTIFWITCYELSDPLYCKCISIVSI